MVEPEERGDDVSEGVAYEGHESADGHEWRRQHCQDGASDRNAGDGADHHNRHHHYSDADLRTAAGGNTLDCRFNRVLFGFYIIIIKVCM